MTRIIAVAVALALAASLPLAACGSKDSGLAKPGVAQRAPAFRPADFVRRVDNPYFPLTPGTTLRYRGESDGDPIEDVFRVTGRIRTILGVHATVVADQVFTRGRMSEDTLDWYAQDRAGNVWYLGEATREVDAHGHTTSTEGSWLSGTHGARPGIFMPAHPRVGQTGQQEYYSGHAEDRYRVASLTAGVHVPFVSSRSALQTSEWTRLEPGVLDAKYYVRGIGSVREETVKGGNERIELVSVTRR